MTYNYVRCIFPRPHGKSISGWWGSVNYSEHDTGAYHKVFLLDRANRREYRIRNRISKRFHKRYLEVARNKASKYYGIKKLKL